MEDIGVSLERKGSVSREMSCFAIISTTISSVSITAVLSDVTYAGSIQKGSYVCHIDDVLLIRYQVAYRMAECPRSPYHSVVTLV